MSARGHRAAGSGSPHRPRSDLPRASRRLRRSEERLGRRSAPVRSLRALRAPGSRFRALVRPRTALPWGSFPFDVSCVSSDSHRACLTRLCCAFRLSQPPDALFRSRPFGLVSCRIRPWGFDLQRFSPPGSHRGFHHELPLVPFAEFRETLTRLQGLMHPGDPFTTELVLPGSVCRSSPGLSPRRGIFPSSLGSPLLKSLLSWASSRRWTSPSP